MAVATKLLHVALFVSGLLATAAGARSLDAMPFHGILRSKLLAWQSQMHAYDTVVIGSSRLDYGLRPAELDQRMRERGHPSTTFNLAYSGMRPHDYIALGEWILDRRPPELKRVLVELMDCDPGDPHGNWLTTARLQTHTLRQLPHRLQSALLNNDSITEVAARFHFAVMHTLAHELNVGQGPRILDDLVHRWNGWKLSGARKVPDQGWRDVAVNPWPANKLAHERLLADPAAAARAIAEKMARKFPPSYATGFNDTAFLQFDRACRSAGVEPCYIVMPALSPHFKGRGGIDALASIATVLDLDDPNAHPQLYERRLWYDRAHLNDLGAAAFATYLANQISDHIDAR